MHGDRPGRRSIRRALAGVLAAGGLLAACGEAKVDRWGGSCVRDPSLVGGQTEAQKQIIGTWSSTSDPDDKEAETTVYYADGRRWIADGDDETPDRFACYQVREYEDHADLRIFANGTEDDAVLRIEIGEERVRFTDAGATLFRVSDKTPEP